MRRREGMGALAMMLFAPAGHACTVCDSQVGHAVRSGILDGHFLRNALLTGAPFPVFFAVGLLIYFKLPVGAAASGGERFGDGRVAR